MRLIYVGRRFYNESESRIGVIYTESGQRADWGMVENALENGCDVSIRLANVVEIAYYEGVLARMKAKKED